ncbi:hypothetical protein MKW94_015065 [Papaver nudicaule]|uniref:GH10 domain-containing protein n=1 Tax=Papaver nudicaule TaxID=74823 RepID=A0AA41S0Q3_PAPNU|nr:hypothetical protein [Papaver nudicaule]
MEAFEVKAWLLLLCGSLLFAGYTVDALSYDYSATIECLEEPLRPQYNGGIIVNPEFSHGLAGWSSFGSAKITHKKSKGGNGFIIAHSRNQSHDTFSQKLYLQKEKLYTFSAWIQVSEGEETVTAIFKTTDGYHQAGATVAQSGCWSMLKGGLTIDSTGYAELYFQSNNTKVDIWVDSVSLQPFTEEQWRSHQVESIAKARKRDVQVHVTNSKGEVLDGAEILFWPRQSKPSFPFGTAIQKDILTNAAYQRWFMSRFTVTVFENELKWYATENIRGKEDYSVADAMLELATRNGIPVRGHTILWNDPKYQPWWVNSLSPAELKAAVAKRIQSVVSRYSGRFIGWDVINENIHFSFFESLLGPDASKVFFQQAHRLDSKTTMFLNDYNTIEQSGDSKSSPVHYLRKLKEIRTFRGNNGPTGIGLEGHFDKPNIPYMRAAIDTLAAARVPIWLTEVDVREDTYQAQYLEQILREAHAHPAVQGILMWAARGPSGCWRMCLTDGNFHNLPTGDVVDKLLNEWKPKRSKGKVDINGDFKTSLFHGDYDVMISHPFMNSTLSQSLKVTAPETYTPETLEETTTIILNVTNMSYEYSNFHPLGFELYLRTPNKGIIVNPELNDGVQGWEALGQDIQKYNKNILFSCSWGTDKAVSAMFKTKDSQLLHAERVFAKSVCWSMLKGGISTYTTCHGDLYFEQDNISIRGHNVYWDNPKTQPRWFAALQHANRKTISKKNRYSVQLIALYLKKLKEIQVSPGNANLPFGIGLQTHVPVLPPNLAFMRAGMDMLGSLGFPMSLTEVDVDRVTLTQLIILKECKTGKFEATTKKKINGYLDTWPSHGVINNSSRNKCFKNYEF